MNLVINVIDSVISRRSKNKLFITLPSNTMKELSQTYTLYFTNVLNLTASSPCIFQELKNQPTTVRCLDHLCETSRSKLSYRLATMTFIIVTVSNGTEWKKH
jgi:hypothetical protein